LEAKEGEDMAGWKDPEIGALRAQLAAALPAPDAPPRSWEEQRMMIDGIGALQPLPEGVRVEATQLGGVPAERIAPKAGPMRGTILYLHGGGYCIGGPGSHRVLVARMALAAEADAWLIDYRLAPEHPFPAAVDDALAAYGALAKDGGDPHRLIISGDSAGGGLTIATFVAAREAGLPAPAGLHVVSPWANLAQTGAAYEAKAALDPILTKAALDRFAEAYLSGRTDAATPLASPLNADLAGLPPILIQVGAEEVLLSDSMSLAEKAALAGADVTLRVWPEMVHIWPFFPLSAGARAIDESAAWMANLLES
jgi:monoterpene epsilon-lactone hydrolase